MSTEAKERQEFRFTIKYHGEKATRLVSGNLTRSEICHIFKDDLTALRVNHPKLEKVRYDPFGSIYFTYIVDQNTDVSDPAGLSFPPCLSDLVLC